MNAQTHLTAITIGRILLGVYFLLPGIMKIVEWDRHIALMQHHDIGYTVPLLLIATGANILLGVLLMANQQVRLAAYGCVGVSFLVQVPTPVQKSDLWQGWDLMACTADWL